MEESLGDFRSTVGFEFTDRGDRSTESREFCKSDGNSDSGLDTTLLPLLALGVTIDALLEFSDRLGLSKSYNDNRSIMHSMEHTVEHKMSKIL